MTRLLRYPHHTCPTRAQDLQLRFRTVADLNLTASDCANLELTDAECTRLANVTARVRGALDVSRDGRVNGDDLQRFSAASLLNVSAADCDTLGLGEAGCGQLLNVTSRLRARLDLNRDGDVSATELLTAQMPSIILNANITKEECDARGLTEQKCGELRRNKTELFAIADLNVTSADCTLLLLDQTQCANLTKLVARARSRLDVSRTAAQPTLPFD